MIKSNMPYVHICTLDKEKNLEKIPALYKITSISAKNPKTKLYFRSMASIEKEKALHRSKHPFIIHPMSIFNFYWTIIMTVTIFLSLIIVPINAIHNPNILKNEQTITMYWIEHGLDLIYLFDIILTFFVGVVYKSHPVLLPKFIFKYNIKSVQLYMDIVTCAPPALIPHMVNSIARPYFHNVANYVEYFPMVKIVRLRKFLKYYDDLTFNSRDHYYHNLLFRYTLIIVIFMHWFSCAIVIVMLFSFIHTDDLYKVIPSLNDGLIAVSDTTSLYCYALYILTSYIFVNGMVSTVDRSLTFQMNKITHVLLFFTFSIVGFITYTFVLVQLIHIRLSMNYTYTKYHRIVAQVKKFLSHKQFPVSKRKRIFVYYEYKFQKRFYAEKNIMEMLSDTLRKEICLHSYRNLIENVALLKDLPPDILSDVVINLKKEIFLYNDVIVKAGTTGDCMYFIANGSVSVSTPTGREICHLQDGAYFGEIALIFREQRRVANVVAIEICEMYRLDRKHFKTCFLSNSSQYKKLEQLAKERMDKTLLLEELHKKYITEKYKKLIHQENFRV